MAIDAPIAFVWRDLSRVVEDDPNCMAHAGPDAAHAVTQVHAVVFQLVYGLSVEGASPADLVKSMQAKSQVLPIVHMRFAAREPAIFSQPEQGFGLIPGAGSILHLVGLMGRARALEVILSVDDYHADLAEGMAGSVEPCPPPLSVTSSHRLLIGSQGFRLQGHVAGKDRVNAIALAPAEDFRRDSDLFGEAVRDPEAQARIRATMKHGFQTPDAEMDLGRLLGRLPGLRPNTEEI